MSGRAQPAPTHVPVMASEVLEMLAVRPGGAWIDCTVGLGGHASAVLEATAPDGRLLGLDVDRRALELAGGRLAGFGDRAALRHCWLDEAAAAAAEAGFERADGVLCDLGASSMQLDEAERGFSFQREGPLDMRLDGGDAEAETASEIANTWSESALADLIYELGEERRSRRIARAIVGRRPLRTTTELADAVASALPGRRGRIHPATNVFRALRLRVNRELERLSAFLADARGMLREGGRLVVIAFHSLEDRIVKRFMQEQSRSDAPAFRALTRRVRRPGEAETAANPRARSARLRAAEAV